jgi:hypothetical protein
LDILYQSPNAYTRMGQLCQPGVPGVRQAFQVRPGQLVDRHVSDRSRFVIYVAGLPDRQTNTSFSEDVVFMWEQYQADCAATESLIENQEPLWYHVFSEGRTIAKTCMRAGSILMFSWRTRSCSVKVAQATRIPRSTHEMSSPFLSDQE